MRERCVQYDHGGDLIGGIWKKEQSLAAKAKTFTSCMIEKWCM